MEDKMSIRIELARQIASVTGHKPRDDIVSYNQYNKKNKADKTDYSSNINLCV